MRPLPLPMPSYDPPSSGVYERVREQRDSSLRRMTALVNDAWANRPKQRRKVLVVEDDPDVREALLNALSNTDYDVTGVPSLAQARVALAASTPDLVVADIKLGDGDGRSLEKTIPTTTSILFVSGVGPHPIHPRSTTRYLSKPVGEDVLLAMVASMLVC